MIFAAVGPETSKLCAVAYARTSLSDECTVTTLGSVFVPVTPHRAARSGAEGMSHGGVLVGGTTRGVLASWRAASHASEAQSRAAPGRAGTSHITRDAPPTVSRDQRVVPNGVTATASSTSTVDGSAEPVGGRTAPVARAESEAKKRAVASAALPAK